MALLLRYHRCCVPLVLALALARPALASAQDPGPPAAGRLSAPSTGTPGRQRWLDLARLLESNRRGSGPAAPLRAALGTLKREEARWNRQQADIARRDLPAKARERQAAAQAAYATGQGRLTQLVGELLALPQASAAAEPLVDEALALLARLELASRPTPISAAEPRVFAPPVRVPALRAPGPASLAITPPESPQEPDTTLVARPLSEQAAALDGPAAVYDWVRNTIRPDFYYGAMRGPLQSFLERRGNDADTAAVLVEMMRAKGIAARYVRGTVETPAGTLLALTGTSTVEQAVRVLERAGIPHDTIAGGGRVAAVRLERVWAEAYVPYANYRGALLDAQGKVWLPLDPAFKPLEPPRGFDVTRELGFEPRAAFDDYLRAVRTSTPLGAVRSSVTALLAAQRPGVAFEDVLNRRFHLEETLGLLPSSLPYAVRDQADVGYDLPSDLVHRIRVAGDGPSGSLFSFERPVPELAGRRVTVSFVPFSDDDRAVVASYGGMAQTPPYLFDVRPVLKVDGQPLASGEAPIGMAVGYALHVEMKTPAVTLAVENRALAGNLTLLGLAGRAEAAVAPEETAAGILDGVARSYFQRWNDGDEELANLLRVVPVRPTTPVCLASSDIEVDYAGGDPHYPVTFEWKGALIDADLRASAPVALGGDTPAAERDFLLLSGLQGSVLEDRVFSEGLQVAAVSTASALGLAASHSIAIHELTSANAPQIVPTLPLDPAVKAEVLDATARGLTVLLPAANTTEDAWTGVGYLLLDEDTGASAWQLQGGHSGGVTVPTVLAWPRTLVDPLLAQGENTLPAPEGAAVRSVQKFGSTDFQFGVVAQVLPQPLKVLVADEAGQPVEGAPVTFHVLGGGGVFVDPFSGARSDSITVSADRHGEASAPLLLGTKTDAIPRYLVFEGDEFATQTGMNMVTASSGAVGLDEPFFAFALPDDQFDGTNQHATVRAHSIESLYCSPLVDCGPLRFEVKDQYENPLSNIPLFLSYRPLPTQIPLPPGDGWARPPTDTPLHLITAEDVARCRLSHPNLHWGQCEGETTAREFRSRFDGLWVYALMGDSMGSEFRIEGGTAAEPEIVKSKLSTWGFVCHSSSPGCSDPTRPIMTVVTGQRWKRANALGNIIEAYPVAGDGDVTLTASVLWEEERIVTESVSPPRYRAEGINVWHLDPLVDSVYTLEPLTPGTGVLPNIAAHSGEGTYTSRLIMASEPQKNRISARGEHYPFQLVYLSPALSYLDPQYVTEGNPPVATRIQRFDKPEVSEDEFSLWGIEPEITAFTPAPILLSAEGQVVRESAVTQRILPADYAALLDPRDVSFQVFRTEEDGSQTSILTAANTQAGGFRIPVGLPAPPGQYNGVLSVDGVNSTATPRVDSAPRPVPICGVVQLLTPAVEISLIRDPDNDVTCGGQQDMVFDLCWEAKVTIKVAGQVLVASLDGQPPAGIVDLVLSAGRHRVAIKEELLGLGANAREPFTVEAATTIDPTLRDQAEGMISNQILNRSVTPVGHTFVKGVDLLDGHVVRSSVDFSVPGRHLGLEITRGYTSTGSSNAGAMGAGWSWSYGGGLFIGDCGLVTVVPAGGDSQVFRTQDGGHTFTPQKGYHTRLVHESEAYDFFDKAGERHHFREPVDPAFPDGGRRLDYIEEPHGDRIVVHYDDSGRVETVAETHPGEGEVRSLKVHYQRRGALDRIDRIEIPALGIRVTYEHDTQGNLTGVRREGTGPDGTPSLPARQESYRYSIADSRDRHQLLTYTGPNGEVVDYRYLSGADVILGEQASTLLQLKVEYTKEVREHVEPGRVQPTDFEWDYRESAAHRYKNTVRDGRGTPTLYVLDGRGSPLEIRDARGQSTFATWAAEDVLKVQEIDAKGRITRYQYDPRGNLIQEDIATDDFGGVTTSYEYDPHFNKLVRKADAEGRSSTWTINADTGDLQAQTDAVGNATTYTYDEHGQLLTQTSPRQFTTTYSNHDSFGHPRRAVDALGNWTEMTYDDRGRLTERTDSFGRDALTGYDAFDRPSSTSASSGDLDSEDQLSSTDYYPGGQIRTVAVPGLSTSYVLDGLNRVVSTSALVEGDVLTSTTHYDLSGNPDHETDRRGVERQNTFDELNRLRTVTITGGPDVAPTGVVASYDYDPVGNKTFETNVAGLRTDYEYDGLYHPTRRRLPESGAGGRYSEVTTYDKVGNRLSVTDPNEHVTHFEYDALNRVTRTENAAGQVTTIAYDDPEHTHVNKSEENDETRGLRTTFGYDALGREVERTVRLQGANSSGETYRTTTSYDDAAHSLTVTDARSTETMRRLNNFDRVILETVDSGDGGLLLTTHTAWDARGNRKRVTDPRSLVTSWTYDGLNRLTGVTDAGGGSTQAIYDGEGLKRQEVDKRGVTRDYVYDNLGRLRLTTLQPVPEMSGVGWSQEIHYLDRARKRTEIDARGQQTTIDLDGLDRPVTTTDALGHSVQTTWDGVNKRSLTDKRHATTLYEYDALDRLVLTHDPVPFQAQTVSALYEDGLNKRTDTDRRGVASVTLMDPLGRVLSVSRAAVLVERHTYDALGNRATSTDAESNVTHFAYDRANRLTGRIDAFGTADASLTTFVVDEDGNVTDERDQRAADLGRPYSVHRTYDELNRVRTEADGGGHSTTYGYDADGHRTLVQQPAGQATNLFYDEMGALVRVMQAAPSSGEARPETLHSYDPSRNRTLQTDARNNAVAMAYDPVNRLRSIVQDPAGLHLETAYERDANGNETLLTDPKLQSVHSTYDALNRLQSRSYSFAPGDDSRPWRYTTSLGYDYDANANPTRLTQALASSLSAPALRSVSSRGARREHSTSDGAWLGAGAVCTAPSDLAFGWAGPTDN